MPDTFVEFAKTRGYILRPDTEFPRSWWVERADDQTLWARWMSGFHEPDRDMWEIIVSLWDADYTLQTREHDRV